MFLKSAEATMKTNKEKLTTMARAHERMTENYQNTYSSLIKYEDIAVDYFSDSDVN
jgi:hypothetical protein